MNVNFDYALQIAYVVMGKLEQTFIKKILMPQPLLSLASQFDSLLNVILSTFSLKHWPICTGLLSNNWQLQQLLKAILDGRDQVLKVMLCAMLPL